jgi:hypothetical protein
MVYNYILLVIDAGMRTMEARNLCGVTSTARSRG